MAAAGFTPIQLFRATTALTAPSAISLAAGELAINLTDEKLYFKNTAGVVKLLAESSGASGTVTSVALSGGTTGLTTSGGPITTAGTITLAGLLAVANGGTGQTTYTNGHLLIGNTTGNTLTKATLTAGTNVSITNGAGAITINSTDQFVGTVTSVAASGGTTGLTFTGSPITTAGTLTLGGTLAVANGGTGVTTSTGTGSVVLNTSPTLVTPILGAASATSIANGLGAVGTPSYTFTADTNTGMWSPAADTVAVSTGGAERLRVTSAGSVGIGTSAPTALLDVSGADARIHGLTVGRGAGSITSNTATGQSALQSNTTGASNTATGTSALFNNTTGSSNTVIGEAAGSALTTGSNNTIIGRVAGTAGLDSTVIIAAGTTERMRIDSSGNVGINESAPDYRLDVNGPIGFTPGASVTPVDNGDVVFELTNNTTLTIKAKGSDGVVRSGTIILV